MNIITKKGVVNRKYAQKIWKHLLGSFIKQMNNELSTKEYEQDVAEFEGMLNKIITKARTSDTAILDMLIETGAIDLERLAKEGMLDNTRESLMGEVRARLPHNDVMPCTYGATGNEKTYGE